MVDLTCVISDFDTVLRAVGMGSRGIDAITEAEQCSADPSDESAISSCDDPRLAIQLVGKAVPRLALLGI